MADSNFYLGREYDPKTQKVIAKNINYDPADLTTHAVVTGMTGSGKTGLCVALLEEAALQGIPAIIIDPKGDLTNLILHFPELAPQDFQPWIDADLGASLWQDSRTGRNGCFHCRGATVSRVGDDPDACLP
jgi:DNA helicase HerA-like ATPase